MRRFSLVLAALLLLLILLGGCSANTTPAAGAVTTPQLQVLQYTQLAAAVNNTAAHSLLALCVAVPGAVAALDAVTCGEVKQYLSAVAQACDEIATEAASTDPWTTARIKIAGIAATVTVNATITNAALKSEITQLQTLITQILGVQ
jgi:hypothetical protein